MFLAGKTSSLYKQKLFNAPSLQHKQSPEIHGHVYRSLVEDPYLRGWQVASSTDQINTVKWVSDSSQGLNKMLCNSVEGFPCSPLWICVFVTALSRQLVQRHYPRTQGISMKKVASEKRERNPCPLLPLRSLELARKLIVFITISSQSIPCNKKAFFLWVPLSTNSGGGGGRNVV